MADRPATERDEAEVVVTPDMIEAGVEAFCFDERYETVGEALERAYVAMRRSERAAMMPIATHNN